MRRFLSLFFLTIFSAFLATTTFVVLIDNTPSVNLAHTTAEEEQNNLEKTAEKLDSQQILGALIINLNFLDFGASNTITTSYKLWDAFYFEMHSPPPELS